MKTQFYLPLIGFLILVVICVIQLVDNSHGDDPTKLESVLIDRPVPKFRLEDLVEPDVLYQRSIFKGQPVLLNIWATWCPTCFSEHQFLNSIAQNGVKIIGLNYKDDRVKAIDWLKRLGNPYLITLYDGDGMLGLDLGVYGAPETFLIDGKGIIRYRQVGDINQDNWTNTLEPLYRQLLEESK